MLISVALFTFGVCQFLSIYKEDRRVALTARSAVNATWRGDMGVLWQGPGASITLYTLVITGLALGVIFLSSGVARLLSFRRLTAIGSDVTSISVRR